ncbi:MAG: hypothetical protein ACJ710_16400, partial [Ornithinibacter sp.]
GDGLGDLQESDQLEPVHALAAGLVTLHVWDRAYSGGSAGISPLLDITQGESRGIRRHRIASGKDSFPTLNV